MLALGGFFFVLGMENLRFRFAWFLHQFRNEAANNLRGNPEFPVSERSSVIEDRFGLVE